MKKTSNSIQETEELRESAEQEHLAELARVTHLGLMNEIALGFAHEVNQPLAAIANYTHISLNIIHSENADLVKLADILYKTQQQALRAGQLINLMRGLTKNHPKLRSSVEINVLIREAVRLCMANIKKNQLELTLKLENNLPTVYADPFQIEQVVINLIRNSIDALQNLPGNRQRRLSLHTQLTAAQEIQVSVEDNGPGINEDQQLKIMLPLYTTKTNSIGMGLTISRSLIEAHGGALHFTSKPGKGSAFYFTLPAE